jgi:hypothetical protein
MIQELNLNIHGVAARCASDDPKQLDFARRNLGPFACDPGQGQASVEGTYSLPDGRWDVQAMAAQGGATRRVGNGLFVGPNLAYWTDAGQYLYALEYRDDRIKASVFVNRSKNRSMRSIGRAVLRPESHRRLAGILRTQAMRLLIHFPVFSLLERDQGISVIHGAAVARDGRAVVLSGLDGVGKSTLAQYLCRQRGFSLLSDNFLLTDGKQIFAFPEMTRLADDSVRSLDIAEKGAERIGNRTLLPTDRFTTTMQADCSAVILNRIGEGCTMEPTSSSSTQAELQRMWHYLPEFIDYGRFRTLGGYIGGEPWPPKSDRAVQDLSENSPCFILVKNGLDRLSQAADMVEKCI